MNRKQAYIRLGLLILSTGPVYAMSADTPTYVPQNVTIICSPGYSYNQQPPVTAENALKPFISDSLQNRKAINFFGFDDVIDLLKPKIPPIPVNIPEEILPPGTKKNSDGSVVVDVKPLNPEQLAPQLVATLASGAGIIINEINKQVTVVQETANNSVTTVVKGVTDIAATYVKAWNDIGNQAKRSFNDLTEAAKAVADFAVKDTRAQFDILQNSANQLQEGKIIDAMWSSGVSPLHSTEKNFFEATQKSSILDMAANYAASVYGGPAGAAAYAAWKTLQLTGDVNLAFRMGLVAAIQQQGGKIIDGMPGATVSDVVKKAAIAGAVGGIAVAAAGGNEKAITDSFLKSSGNVLVQNAQDSVKAVMNNNSDITAAVQVVGCISAKNVNCLSDVPYVTDAAGKLTEQVAPSLTDLKSKADEVVGTWTALQNNAEKQAADIMTLIPKLPDTNIIPLANNSVVITWTLGSEAEIKSGIPTVLISAIGDNAPFVSTANYSPVQPAVK
ncbi:hypothetical protein [Buttiauxella gaviniae]|uniref:hypothetical protein n=1 Tax=Buttiauxella gaviniae TaxID=82990 RepID=UPI003C734E79